MPQQTKIFRVFVSSTFTDMKEERMILQKEVFPELEKFCEERGARFQGVDLRWGVSENVSLNQKTLQVCLNEIARCQKISPKPNFLVLLGDKYGWQPVPEKISLPDMQKMSPHFSAEEKKMIIRETGDDPGWYRLDSNAVPAEYILQPKGDNYQKYEEWEPVEAKIRDLLRKAIRSECRGNEAVMKEQWSGYFTSATHQEIIRGVLKPEDGEDPKEHVLAFVRKIDEMPDGPEAEGFCDLAGGKQDPYCKKQLDDLKAELKDALGVNYRGYTTNWKENRSLMPETARKEFREKVLSFLKEIIEPQTKGVHDDEVTLEATLHEEFRNRLTLHFKGREDILGKIRKYLEDVNEKRVLSVIGLSGSGKSSVMAKAARRCENTGAVVVCRFIGATSRSSNIMSLLQSICGEIAKGFNIDARSLAREGDDKAWHDINGLTEILRKCLALATPGKPVLMFLDSLDQLSDTDNARALYWLPRELPDSCRLVVSSLDELKDKLTSTCMEELSPLPEKEAIEILQTWLASINRTLADGQRELVLNGFSHSKLPIYLKLAFEKAKKWHSYDPRHSLKEDVKGIIEDYFEDLEGEHDEAFVRNAVCYLLSGRYQGLAENEILEILAFDDDYWEIFLDKNKYHALELKELKKELEKPTNGQRGYMKIPIAVWSRLFLDLEPFLTERDADGVPIITFFHRQFNEVLRKKYGLPDPSIKN